MTRTDANTLIRSYVHTFIRLHAYTHTFIRSYAYTHTLTRSYTHAHARTRTHTRAHTRTTVPDTASRVKTRVPRHFRFCHFVRPEIQRPRFFRCLRISPSVLNFPSDAIISDLFKFGIPEILPSPKRKVIFHLGKSPNPHIKRKVIFHLGKSPFWKIGNLKM